MVPLVAALIVIFCMLIVIKYNNEVANPCLARQQANNELEMAIDELEKHRENRIKIIEQVTETIKALNTELGTGIDEENAIRTRAIQQLNKNVAFKNSDISPLTVKINAVITMLSTFIKLNKPIPKLVFAAEVAKLNL